MKNTHQSETLLVSEYLSFVADLREIPKKEKAKKIDPDSVIVMLTGQGKLDASLKALNGGKIFRFLIRFF